VGGIAVIYWLYVVEANVIYAICTICI
jgi:hypothetical protein